MGDGATCHYCRKSYGDCICGKPAEKRKVNPVVRDLINIALDESLCPKDVECESAAMVGRPGYSWEKEMAVCLRCWLTAIENASGEPLV